MMMSLGMFVFELATTPYQQMQHQLAWRHPSNSRVGARPARQFTGVDDETITLSGTLLPEITGGDSDLKKLSDMGDKGEAYTLIEGTGLVYGEFEIDSLDTTRDYFFEDGKARRIDFTLKLTRVDDKDPPVAD